MKVSQKGIVRNITPVVGKRDASGKEMFLQSVIVMIPGYTNGFGEKVGRDQFWEFLLMNENITKHKLNNEDWKGKKVEITGYLNCRNYSTGGDERFQYTINFHSMVEFKLAK